LVPGSKLGIAGDTGHRFALVVNNDRVFASEVHDCVTSDKKINRPLSHGSDFHSLLLIAFVCKSIRPATGKFVSENTEVNALRRWIFRGISHL